MDLHLTTMLDASSVTEAYGAYKSGNYQKALALLQAILDTEPENWQARLVVAACFFKTSQIFTAQRAFQFICNQCKDAELAERAQRALTLVNAEAAKRQGHGPLEFGEFIDKATPTKTPNIDSIILAAPDTVPI